MSKPQLRSIFTEISTSVFNSVLPLEETKQVTIKFVESRDINDKDKQTIIKNISECKTFVRLHTYICNSLLQYEGLGMNQLDKGKVDKNNKMDNDEV